MPYTELHAKSFAAPALARGIQVIRLLEELASREGGAGLALDAIAKKVGQPKSSLLRILKTLEDLGLVAASTRGRSKEYCGSVCLVPVGAPEGDFAARLPQALEETALATGKVAEWYVQAPAGMVLVRRAEPAGAEVRVRARIGFLRPWEGELEAVSAVALAWMRGKRRRDRHHAYVRDGVTGRLSAGEAERRVQHARERGYAVDEVYNANGVRRTACVALHGDRPAGILATAGHYVPGGKEKRQRNLKALLRAAQRLSVGTAFRFSAGKGTR